MSGRRYPARSGNVRFSTADLTDSLRPPGDERRGRNKPADWHPHPSKSQHPISRKSAPLKQKKPQKEKDTRATTLHPVAPQETPKQLSTNVNLQAANPKGEEIVSQLQSPPLVSTFSGPSFPSLPSQVLMHVLSISQPSSQDSSQQSSPTTSQGDDPTKRKKRTKKKKKHVPVTSKVDEGTFSLSHHSQELERARLLQQQQQQQQQQQPKQKQPVATSSVVTNDKEGHKKNGLRDRNTSPTPQLITQEWPTTPVVPSSDTEQDRDEDQDQHMSTLDKSQSQSQRRSQQKYASNSIPSASQVSPQKKHSSSSQNAVLETEASSQNQVTFKNTSNEKTASQPPSTSASSSHPKENSQSQSTGSGPHKKPFSDSMESITLSQLQPGQRFRSISPVNDTEDEDKDYDESGEANDENDGGFVFGYASRSTLETPSGTDERITITTQEPGDEIAMRFEEEEEDRLERRHEGGKLGLVLELDNDDELGSLPSFGYRSSRTSKTTELTTGHQTGSDADHNDPKGPGRQRRSTGSRRKSGERLEAIPLIELGTTQSTEESHQARQKSTDQKSVPSSQGSLAGVKIDSQVDRSTLKRRLSKVLDEPLEQPERPIVERLVSVEIPARVHPVVEEKTFATRATARKGAKDHDNQATTHIQVGGATKSLSQERHENDTNDAASGVKASRRPSMRMSVPKRPPRALKKYVMSSESDVNDSPSEEESDFMPEPSEMPRRSKRIREASEDSFSAVVPTHLSTSSGSDESIDSQEYREQSQTDEDAEAMDEWDNTDPSEIEDQTADIAEEEEEEEPILEVADQITSVQDDLDESTWVEENDSEAHKETDGDMEVDEDNMDEGEDNNDGLDRISRRLVELWRRRSIQWPLRTEKMEEGDPAEPYSLDFVFGTAVPLVGHPA